MDELQVLDTDVDLTIGKKPLKKSSPTKLEPHERLWVGKEWFNETQGDYKRCDKEKLEAMGVAADTFETNIVPINGFYGLGMAPGPETVAVPWYAFMIPTTEYKKWTQVKPPDGVKKQDAWDAPSIDAKVYALLVACKKMAVAAENKKTQVNALPPPPDAFVVDEPIAPSPPE